MKRTGRLQMRLKPDIEDYIDNRVGVLGGNRSDYIMFLIAKDREPIADEKMYWASAVDEQLKELKDMIVALESVKKDLVG